MLIMHLSQKYSSEGRQQSSVVRVSLREKSKPNELKVQWGPGTEEQDKMRQNCVTRDVPGGWRAGHTGVVMWHMTEEVSIFTRIGQGAVQVTGTKGAKGHKE